MASGNLWPLFTAAPLAGRLQLRWLWPVSVVAAVGVGALWIGKARLGPLAFGGVAGSSGGWLLASWPGVLPGWGMVGLAGGLDRRSLLDCDGGGGCGGSDLATLGRHGLGGPLPGAGGHDGGRGAGRASGRSMVRSSRVRSHARGDPSVDSGSPDRAAPPICPGRAGRSDPVSYRLIDGGVATLEQAYLPEFPGRATQSWPRVIIDHLIRGVDLRPGAALAEFGIGWVVVLPGSDFDTHALDRQVDLALTPVDPELTVYENLAESARAVTDNGAVWAWDGRTYRGEPTDGRVRLADNADARWGPDWASADGWANSVSGEDGEAIFTPGLVDAGGRAGIRSRFSWSFSFSSCGGPAPLPSASRQRVPGSG